MSRYGLINPLLRRELHQWKRNRFLVYGLLVILLIYTSKISGRPLPMWLWVGPYNLSIIPLLVTYMSVNREKSRTTMEQIFMTPMSDRLIMAKFMACLAVSIALIAAFDFLFVTVSWIRLYPISYVFLETIVGLGGEGEIWDFFKRSCTMAPLLIAVFLLASTIIRNNILRLVGVIAINYVCFHAHIGLSRAGGGGLIAHGFPITVLIGAGLVYLFRKPFAQALVNG